jgi:acetate kinase
VEVLVMNSGSSSIKYQLFDMTDRSVLASGLLERISEADGVATHRVRAGGPGAGLDERVDRRPIPDHDEGFRRIVAALEGAGHGGELSGIGHRVVHGGEAFFAPTLIDDDVIARIRAQIPLAPLHNPANLRGIEVAYALRPDVPQVAVFDTAFHRSLPPRAYRYAIPTRLYTESHIRRYGFHGTSHEYVARRAAEHLGILFDEVNLISLHLGNGASATAVARGRSVDTSMGLSPLEGLVMGTRSGDLDPAVVFHLTRDEAMSVEQVEALLNRASGLKGMTGENDMRAVERLAADGDEAARLALEVYCYRIRKYIGAYLAVLGQVDALVFTAGVGENSPAVRAGSCEGLEPLGIRLDRERNDRRAAGSLLAVHADDSAVAILVVPTNEELAIAEQTLARVTNDRTPPAWP